MDGSIVYFFFIRRRRTPKSKRTDTLCPYTTRFRSEGAGQGEKIEPRAMRFTGLANAAIDRIMPDPASFAAGIHVYGESDLLCYRADAPAALVARQAAADRKSTRLNSRH